MGIYIDHCSEGSAVGHDGVDGLPGMAALIL